MIKMVFAATLAALYTTNAQADTVGLYLGGQVWQNEASGLFDEKNISTDFNLKKEQQISYFIAIEHPFPLLPNVRVSHTTFDTTGKTNLTQDYSDDNQVSHVNVHSEFDINANFNVSYIDYTLYYEIFDNDLLSFDLGLTARDFGGAITVTETTNIVTITRDRVWDGEEHDDHDYHNIIETTEAITTDKIKTNDIKAMLYVATNIHLPLTGLNLFAQGDFVLIDDHTIADYQIGVSYDLIDSRAVDLNVSAGYRTVKMEFEDPIDLYTELEFKGAFIGVTAHF